MASITVTGKIIDTKKWHGNTKILKLLDSESGNEYKILSYHPYCNGIEKGDIWTISGDFIFEKKECILKVRGKTFIYRSQKKDIVERMNEFAEKAVFLGGDEINKGGNGNNGKPGGSL